MEHKSSKRKRGFRKNTGVAQADAKGVRRLLGRR